MKKQLLKLGAFCFALTIAGTAVAQEDPITDAFKKTEVAPTIDGEVDAIWENVTAREITRLQPDQTVSMVDGAAPTWKAMWDADNTYILVEVPDDHCYTHVEAGVESWLADKPEIYFDVNPDKVGEAPVGPSTSGSGHYQFADDFTSMDTPPTNHSVAFTIDGDDANYKFEYAIPHASMADLDANPFSPVEDVTVIGFDITILDLDEDGAGANVAIGRVNWSNDMNGAGESWVDMDKSGDVEYSSELVTTSIKSNKAERIQVVKAVVAGELVLAVDAVSVEVINIAGAKVAASTDVAHLNAGVYVAVAKLRNGTTAAQKFNID